ncbi:phenylacetyl-CoA ligase-like protein, partial [Aureobasidium pullulans]
IDYITAVYGIHRLSGVVTPANAVYSSAELEHQVKSSGSQLVITCTELLPVALAAVKAAGLPQENVILLPMPEDDSSNKEPFLTLEDLIKRGEKLPPLEPLRWSNGQGRRQSAFLCYSSGTSGLPNVIANILQYVLYESVGRAKKRVTTQNLAAPLPMSHIYALVMASHGAVWRGDGYIVLPKYDLRAFLNAIQRFRVAHVLVVPPIILQMLNSQDLCREYDLSSLRFVYSGAAPLGEETIQQVSRSYPSWTIGQAYGMTETAVLVTSPSEHDVLHKASGSLLPGVLVKLLDAENHEITGYDISGEVLVQTPSAALGYLNNETATSETFVNDQHGRWVRTGDEALMTLAPSGNEQLVIVDRIKELIKVKGHQVAPAELEAHILSHPSVADCAVIQIPDDRAGEIPKAFVVRTPESDSKSEVQIAKDIIQWVADHKASYKHIRGGVEFRNMIPKSPSGKILRRLLRDEEKKKSARLASKL